MPKTSVSAIPPLLLIEKRQVKNRLAFWCEGGTRTPKDKPHAPQTCASASSATLAYLLYSSPVFEVENRWCGLLGYSNIFPAIRQVVSLFLISFFMLHIYNSSAARAKAALRAIAQVICTRKVPAALRPEQRRGLYMKQFVQRAGGRIGLWGGLLAAALAAFAAGGWCRHARRWAAS